MFTALAMASATTATISFAFAEKNSLSPEKSAWEKLGVGSFATHIASILGIIATLFYMIYTHDYRYHYVWSHSSNELPVYYMISCFWEGQEGSFLLWTFWHAVLGGILLRNKSEWRNLVMAVIASIQMVLCTMILGAYFGEIWVKGFYVLALLIPAAVFAKPLINNKSDLKKLSFQGNFHIASLILPVLVLLLILRNQTGFGDIWSFQKAISSGTNAIFSLFVLSVIGYIIFYIYFLRKNIAQQQYPEIFAGAMLAALAVVISLVENSSWKIGSTPFMQLRYAMANAPIFQTEPNFVPTNGSGLNALLQNYWMVIHPPTLFLGFASTIVPFAFMVAGLIKGKYDAWIAPARTWLLFSVMILGIGIIMGGYWAYETLNFGGYWNWDPVENASLVPWLTGVASLHGLLMYQKNKSYLKFSMILISSTFLLVLYSTFLTRSGILGETSVHTFTDLGLSGQLLVLVFAYLIPVFLLFAIRWKEIPTKDEESSLWTAEFFLFLGTLIFVFAGAEICFSTSLPVFNKIFGTHIAPPVKLQLFYYKWNVWFAILFGVLSGIGQFLWWKMAEKKKLSDALFRPFVIAAVCGSAVIIFLTYKQMPFSYHQSFSDTWAEGGIANYISYIFLAFADEILLFTSLFAIAANGDLLVAMLRKNTKGLKVMGGTVAHIGFSLMLIGMLFSSGFDAVVSKNLTPEELKGFKGDDQNDNILLPVGITRQIPGYFVKYLGKKEAKAPLQAITVLENNPNVVKIKFADATGETFAQELPKAIFAKKKGTSETPVHALSNSSEDINMEYVREFMNKNLQYLKPKLINNRTIFQVEFTSITDSSKKFRLYPESEVNQEMGGLLSHPSRKIFAERDIYAFVSSMPDPKEAEVEPKYHDFKAKVGDKFFIGKIEVTLTGLQDLSNKEETKDLSLAVAAMLSIKMDSLQYEAKPVYTIDNARRPGMIEAKVPELGLTFAFVNVNPKEGVIQLQVEQQAAGNDWIVLKAIEKPAINLLWLGTFVLTAGFLIAIYRRRKERKRIFDAFQG